MREIKVRLSDTSFARLKFLKTKAGTNDLGEVLSGALRLYEQLLLRDERGEKLYERDGDEFREYPLFE